MELNNFILKFKEQFIDADEISIEKNTKFRNLESWDSLTGMSVLVMVKDDFGIDISVDEFKSFITVEDVYNFIKKE